jgi:iron complex transport system permease protein
MRIRSNILIFGVLVAALAVACTAALFSGTAWVSAAEMSRMGILQLRVARILMAVVAGAGLSVAGVIFQAVFRNPLAEPYLLGVSSGAGLGAAVAILLNLSILGMWTIPGLAFAAALGTILLVYGLARDRSGATPIHTLLLSGVMVNAVFGSALMLLLTLSNVDKLRNIIFWLWGDLQVNDWALLRAAAIVVALGLIVTTLLSRELNVITLGEEPAAHLGLNVERTKRLFLLLAALMTGATVAACGLIGFVGLIVPHSVRMVIGPDHRRLVPATALAGATFLVLADGYARIAMAAQDIPIGVVTALLGGPFFFVLLRRKRRSSWA